MLPVRGTWRPWLTLRVWEEGNARAARRTERGSAARRLLTSRGNRNPLWAFHVVPATRLQQQSERIAIRSL
ncbi:unnamed protein product [Lampetra fluviatilis]